MFSGIGGFELGIQRALDNKQLAEIEQDRERRDRNPNEQGTLLLSPEKSALCVGYSEIDKYAIETYEKHFGGHKNYGDATKIKPEELPDFDMLVGGFPCQSFSIAGKRKGFEDTRGTLFFDIARIIKIKRPKIVWLENVKGLLNHNKGETFRIILQTLSELGYDVQWQVLNSKHFGVPQNRERVFIIGSIRGESRPKVFPFRRINTKINEKDEAIMIDVYNKRLRKECPTLTDPCHNSIRVADFRNDEGLRIRKESIAPCLAARKHSATDISTMPSLILKEKIRAVLTPNRKEKRQNGRRFKEDGEPSFTLTGQDQHGIMIEKDITCPTLTTELSHSTGRDFFRNMGQQIYKASNQIRRLTPIECERLQGFPDNWTIGSDTQRYKQCGNAVTVNVIQAIAEKLLI